MAQCVAADGRPAARLSWLLGMYFRSIAWAALSNGRFKLNTVDKHFSNARIFERALLNTSPRH